MKNGIEKWRKIGSYYDRYASDEEWNWEMKKEVAITIDMQVMKNGIRVMEEWI